MTKNSYCFCYIVLNAGAYLDYSLASTIRLANMHRDSCIILVEAADRFSHQLEKTNNGLSIDGTREIIEKWEDLYPDKIRYEALGNINDKRESRNVCLEIARSEFTNNTLIYNVDGDELMKKKDFIALDNYITDHPNTLSFWIKQYLFWGDFRTRYGDEFAGYKEAVFYNTQNMEYGWWHTQVGLIGSPPLTKFMPDALVRIDIPFYHYGHICSEKRMFLKRLYSCSQLQWFTDNVQEIETLWKKGKKPWEEFFKGQPWEGEQPWGTDRWVECEKVDLSEHPTDIHSHPWYNLTKEEVWASTDVYPTFFRR